ncbi:MAG: hypothetical protein P4N60_18170 [Verrucomicrobiae bacterium]|nr:hypothetical protein [Verrucomicrobiae bacterium]
MKMRQSIILFVTLGVLIAAGVSASADEPKPSQSNTSLSNATISGYVDVSISGQVQPAAHLSWWQKFSLWIKAHGR